MLEQRVDGQLEASAPSGFGSQRVMVIESSPLASMSRIRAASYHAQLAHGVHDEGVRGIRRRRPVAALGKSVATADAAERRNDVGAAVRGSLVPPRLGHA